MASAIVAAERVERCLTPCVGFELLGCRLSEVPGVLGDGGLHPAKKRVAFVVEAGAVAAHGQRQRRLDLMQAVEEVNQPVGVLQSDFPDLVGAGADWLAGILSAKRPSVDGGR
jgi:hypothetical protein